MPSFIATLGMMLVLFGAIRLWTGGAPTGALSEGFRALGRKGIARTSRAVARCRGALLIAIVVVGLAVLLMRRPFGRTLVAVGDNAIAAAFSRRLGVVAAHAARSCCQPARPPSPAILIGGFAGLTAQVGDGLEFMAITAVVLGGVVLGGGRGLGPGRHGRRR